MALAAIALLALIYVPVNAAATQIQVSSPNGASGELSLPASAWVTVHFDHPGGMQMIYWMDEPDGGMMFHHRSMMNGDSYSFWSDGGVYECWAGYYGAPDQAPTVVWVNATWGAL